MRPTRVTTLLLTALVTGLVTFLLVSQFYSDLPPLPRTAALSTLVLAGAEAFVAPSIRNRLAGKPRTKPIMPMVVARTAALAKASSALASALAGLWAGFAAYVLPRDAPTPRRDLRTALLGLVAALLLAAAALWLENVCRVKHPPPGEPPPAEPGP